MRNWKLSPTIIIDMNPKLCLILKIFPLYRSLFCKLLDFEILLYSPNNQ